jgi:hypothetical protein
VYGKLTLENCVLSGTNTNLIVMDGGELTFIGYNNTITRIEDPLKGLNGSTINGQVTVIYSNYADPGSFSDAGIKLFGNAKAVIPDFRAMWCAFGLLGENGSQIRAENCLSINSFRDGIVTRGGHVYAPGAGLKKLTSGYCGYNEYGTIYVPNSALVNGGGSTTSGCYTAATDVE